METQTWQPLSKKLAWSGGSLSAGLTGQVVGAYVLLFYVDRAGLPLSYFNIAMIIWAIWNAINDPLFGYLSDRTKTRWGRRIPYILFLSLPYAISFAFVWCIPGVAAGNPLLLFLYLVGILFVYDALFTVVVLNWTALYPEMYPSLRERAQVGAIRQVFGLVGTGVGLAVAPMLFGTVGWFKMGLIFAAVTAVGMYVSLLGSRERPETHGGEAVPLLPALKFTFLNRSFLTFVMVSFFAQLCFGVMLAVMPLYAQYVLGTSDAQLSLLWAAVFGAALVMFFFWPAVIRKLAPRRSVMLATVLFALGLVPFLFIGTLRSALIAMPFLGLGLAGLLMLIDILISDVIDEDQLRTGTRREGMYFGVNGFVIRLSIAVQNLTISVILGAAGFIEGQAGGVQPAAVIPALRVLMTWVPWVALALALVAAYLHKLDGPRLEEVKRRLGELQKTQASG